MFSWPYLCIIFGSRVNPLFMSLLDLLMLYNLCLLVAAMNTVVYVWISIDLPVHCGFVQGMKRPSSRRLLKATLVSEGYFVVIITITKWWASAVHFAVIIAIITSWMTSEISIVARKALSSSLSPKDGLRGVRCGHCYQHHYHLLLLLSPALI